MKAGVTYQHTFLNEHDQFGIVDPTLNSFASTLTEVPTPILPSLALGNAEDRKTLAAQRIRASMVSCFLWTSPAEGAFSFYGHEDIKLLSLYLQDSITKGNFTLNLGFRGDLYNGFVSPMKRSPAPALPTTLKKLILFCVFPTRDCWKPRLTRT